MGTCKECKFFMERDFRQDPVCKRFPPIYVGDGRVSSAPISADDWCGEFKLKRDPTKICAECKNFDSKEGLCLFGGETKPEETCTLWESV